MKASTPDVCIIGAGSGGLTVAAGAAAFGVETVLVERGQMGGDCLNHGCVPSKALIASARHAASIREAGVFGVSAGPVSIDFAAVKAHIDNVIASIAPNDSVARFEGLGVRVIQAEGRFVDRRTLVAGGETIRARRFVIATGSAPLVPPIEGLANVPYLTNETLFALTERPGHLLVVGGGPIGAEMAQAHRRLGARVTIVEGGRFLSREDPELSAVVAERLRREGVEIIEGTDVRRAECEDAGLRLHLAARADGAASSVLGSHVLLAAGRRPALAALDPDAAGVRHDAHGVLVGRDLRSSNPCIYAIGDAAGGPQFTHVANLQAGLVLRAILFRLPIRFDRDAVPRVTYTEPELGQVGLTRGEAEARGLCVEVLRWPYTANDRAETERRTEGLLTLVVGRGRRIIGAGVVGAQAGELTNLLSLAIAQRLTLRDLAGFVSPYPTYGEIAKRAATAHFAPYAARPLVRRLVRILARLG